jgi:dTDP-4-dehydrorhamnose reductase
MSARPRILLIGSTGQVGWELMRTLAPLGEVVAASICGRYGPVVDLTDAPAVARLIAGAAPQLIVNAAAYTAVDKAEVEPDLARRINADACGVIGEQALRLGAGVLHYSTDFVFAGDARRPYREADEPAPLGVYGETKLAGERQLLETGAAAVVLRTSWVYGARGQNFLLTMQRLFRERDQVNVVDDQIGAPTWSRMLAEVSAQILAPTLAGRLDLQAVRGLYHLSGGGQTSWYGFARAIWEAGDYRAQLAPIPSVAYPTPARRPAYSVLDNQRFRDTFGLALPDWRYSLAQCLEEQQH